MICATCHIPYVRPFNTYEAFQFYREFRFLFSLLLKTQEKECAIL